MSPQTPPDHPSEPRPVPSGIVTFILALSGAILLLPGLCSLGFAAFFGLAGGFTDPMIVTLWIVCFGISAGGILMIRAAVLRSRGKSSAPQE